LLVEVEGRGEIHRALGVPDPGLTARPTPWGFQALSITPREAVPEYLRRTPGFAGSPWRSFAPGRSITWWERRPACKTCSRSLAPRNPGRRGRLSSQHRRVLGAEVLADLAEFLAAFQGLYTGFKDRAKRVLELMGSPECAFVVVAAPTDVSLEEARYFTGRFITEGMKTSAVVANRWHGAVRRLPPGAAKTAANLQRGSVAHRALAGGPPAPAVGGPPCGAGFRGGVHVRLIMRGPRGPAAGARTRRPGSAGPR
jgi:hypothetical protein